MRISNPEAHLDDSLSSPFRRWNDKGYVEVREDGKRWRKEHHVIAEAKLGRKLRKGECVHHWNTDKTDNRPCNLIVLRNGTHTRIHAKGYFKFDSEQRRSLFVPTKVRWHHYFNLFGQFHRLVNNMSTPDNPECNWLF